MDNDRAHRLQAGRDKVTYHMMMWLMMPPWGHYDKSPHLRIAPIGLPEDYTPLSLTYPLTPPLNIISLGLSAAIYAGRLEPHPLVIPFPPPLIPSQFLAFKKKRRKKRSLDGLVNGEASSHLDSSDSNLSANESRLSGSLLDDREEEEDAGAAATSLGAAAAIPLGAMDHHRMRRLSDHSLDAMCASLTEVDVDECSQIDVPSLAEEDDDDAAIRELAKTTATAFRHQDQSEYASGTEGDYAKIVADESSSLAADNDDEHHPAGDPRPAAESSLITGASLTQSLHSTSSSSSASSATTVFDASKAEMTTSLGDSRTSGRPSCSAPALTVVFSAGVTGGITHLGRVDCFLWRFE